MDARCQTLSEGLPADLWPEILEELAQLERMRAHGRLAIYLDVVEGRVQNFSFERRRNRPARTARKEGGAALKISP